MSEKSKKPEHEILLGAIKATIWKNETDGKVNHNIKICKIYKQDKEWKETSNFSKTDLPLVTKVSDLAHTYLYESKQE